MRGNGWALRLIPYSFTIDGYDEGKPRTTINWGQAINIGNESTTAEQKQLYQLLLKMDWLPPALRRVIMEELGLSLRDQNRRTEEVRTITLRCLIEERKQALRAQGQRPRGGVHEAALEEIAGRQGMTVEALKKRLERLKQRAKKRSTKTGRH
jgi:hypothetical protein